MKLLHLCTIVILLFVCTMMGCVSQSYVRYEVYKAKIETLRWANLIALDCQEDISRRLEEAENMTTRDYLNDKQGATK